MEGVVDVTLRAAVIERVAVVGIEGQAAAQSLRKIRIGEKMATEGDEARVALLQDRFGPGAVEAAGGDDRSAEPPTQRARGHRRPAIVGDTALHPWLDDVEIGEPATGKR